MPLGAHITSVARAVLELDRVGFHAGLAESQADLNRFAKTGTRELEGMSAQQVRAVRYQREYNESLARFGPESRQAIRALERLKFAEQAAARENNIAARSGRGRNTASRLRTRSTDPA